MDKQVLLDKLSEFLMVEQAGFQLYQVAASRTVDSQLKARYEQFGQQTARHREVLIKIIERLGGDPNYVSPTARVAQLKGDNMLAETVRLSGLSMREIEGLDLHNVVLAETTDHANWQLLEMLVEQAPDGEAKNALREGVAEVEAEEDEHIQWAKETWSRMSMEMIMEGPAPEVERLAEVITSPMWRVDQAHPAPIKKGLSELAGMPFWEDSAVVRATRGPAVATRQRGGRSGNGARKRGS